ncbi:SBBP repeat-containing protein [bacterium]|nr:SBBP repeat-containing protein [bacterium]
MWSTYLGDTTEDFGRGITVDIPGNIFVTGVMDSSNWPWGDYNAFVVKIDTKNGVEWDWRLLK